MSYKLMLWIIFSVLVGLYARNKGRSFLSYFLLSIIISPLIAFITLTIYSFIKRDKSKNIVEINLINNNSQSTNICRFCGVINEKSLIYCCSCDKPL